MRAVITPGRLKDRKSFMAGPFKSARLTRAAFSTLLGPFSFDPQAKAQAGQAALYVINGFKYALAHLLSRCLQLHLPEKITKILKQMWTREACQGLGHGRRLTDWLVKWNVT